MTHVYIKQSKSGKSVKVIDVKTQKPWANETFKNVEAAAQFCKDNKLKIKKCNNSEIKSVLKGLYALLFIVGFIACNPAKTTSQKVNGKPATILQDQTTSEEISEKPFSNPAIIYGSDFISFLVQLKTSNPGNYDRLLDFTSAITKKQYSKRDILNWYEKTNLNFHKKLKAIRKVNDTLYILNYESNIYATKSIRTFTVSVENDTCRILLSNLNLLK